MIDKKRKEQMLAVVGIVGAAGLILWYFRHMQPDGTIGPATQEQQQLPTVQAEGFAPQQYTPGAINIPGLVNGGFSVPGTTAVSPSNALSLTTVNFLPSSPFQFVPSAPVPVVTVGGNTTNYPGGVTSPDGGTTNGCGCNQGGGTNTVSFGNAVAQAAYMGGAAQNSNSLYGPVSPVRNLQAGVNSALEGVANFVINLITPATPSTTVQPIVVNKAASTQPQFQPGAGFFDPVDAPFKSLLTYPA